MSPSPRCSIIIPVYGRAELTEQCLEAISALRESTPFEIVVVDNASPDDTIPRIAGRGIELIENSENLGFSRACNQGARIAQGELLVLLNNDTIPLRGWLDALVATADRDPDVGIVGSKLLYPDGTLQHGGVGMSRFSRGPYLRYRHMPRSHPAANRGAPGRAVTGACMLIRADVYTALGGLDELFVNGFEDVDLCLRAIERGHGVYYEPASELIHLEGQSEGRESQTPENFARFRARWSDPLLVDEDANAFRADLRVYGRPTPQGFEVGALPIEPEERDRWEIVARIQERGFRAIGPSIEDLRRPDLWPRDEPVLLWGEAVCRHHGLRDEADAFRAETLRMNAPARTQPRRTPTPTRARRVLHVLPAEPEALAHANALASAMEAEGIATAVCRIDELTRVSLAEFSAVHFADFDDVDLATLEGVGKSGVSALVSVRTPGLFCGRGTSIDASGSHCARGPESLDTCHACIYGPPDPRRATDFGRNFAALAGRRAENTAKMRAAAFVRFTSTFLEKQAERYGYHARRHAVVLPGAIPFETEPTKPASAVDAGPCIVHVGPIADDCGMPTLLAAIERTIDARRRRGLTPRSRYLFFGPCNRGSEACAMFARACARPEIGYAGSRFEPADPYRVADVVVVPNGGEDCPASIRQALWAGIPVVAPRTGGIPEQFPEGAAGLLLPPDDVDALARVLERFESSPLALPERGSRAQVPTVADEARALTEILTTLEPAS